LVWANDTFAQGKLTLPRLPPTSEPAIFAPAQPALTFKQPGFTFQHSPPTAKKLATTFQQSPLTAKK
jgi:hypothetical protein